MHTFCTLHTFCRICTPHTFFTLRTHVHSVFAKASDHTQALFQVKAFKYTSKIFLHIIATMGTAMGKCPHFLSRRQSALLCSWIHQLGQNSICSRYISHEPVVSKYSMPNMKWSFASRAKMMQRSPLYCDLFVCSSHSLFERNTPLI